MLDKDQGPPISSTRVFSGSVPLKRVHLPNIVLFPSGLHGDLKFTEKEIRAGYLEYTRPKPYLVLQPQITRNPNIGIGLLGKILNRREENGVQRFDLMGILRVRITGIENKKGMLFAKILPILDRPSPTEIEQNPDFHSALPIFKGLCEELLEGIDDELTAEQWLQAIMEKARNADSETISQVIDAIMNLLNHLEIGGGDGFDMSMPSVIIFQEEDTLKRLMLCIGLLDKLLHGEIIEKPPEKRGRDGHKIRKPDDDPVKIATHDQKIVSRKELVNVIFYDEAAPPDNTDPDETAELDIPESTDPPIIAKSREFLSGRVIGQDRAIRTIVRSFNLAKAGIFPKEGPLLILYCAGPSRVGKTETAFALGDMLWQLEKDVLARAKEKGQKLPFSEEDIASPPLIKIDCGLLAGSLTHGASNLIGAPAGFVGSKGTGKSAQPPILSPKNFPSNRIRVLLFDEFEKAILQSRDYGAELIGILVNMLDKGILVNNWGDEVSFHLTIVIFTSNLGTKEIMDKAEDPKIGFGRGTKRKHLTEEEIEKLNDRIYESTREIYEKTFPQEFRNRITRFIVYRFLTYLDYRAIIAKEFAYFQKVIKEQCGIEVVLSEDAVQWMLSEIRAEEGVQKLRIFMEKEIADPLARAHNLGRLKRGKTYEVYTKQKPVKRNGKNGEDGDSETKAVFKIKKVEQGSPR